MVIVESSITFLGDAVKKMILFISALIISYPMNGMKAPFNNQRFTRYQATSYAQQKTDVVIHINPLNQKVATDDISVEYSSMREEKLQETTESLRRYSDPQTPRKQYGRLERFGRNHTGKLALGALAVVTGGLMYSLIQWSPVIENGIGSIESLNGNVNQLNGDCNQLKTVFEAAITTCSKCFQSMGK